MKLNKILALCLSTAIFASGIAVGAEDILHGTEVRPEAEGTILIVELDGGGVIERTSGTSVSERAALMQINSVRANAAAKVCDVTGGDIINNYAHIMNGFSVEGNAEDIERLKSIDGVKDVYVSYPRFQTAESDLTDAEVVTLSLSDEVKAVSTASDDTEYTGKGTVIAVIDNEFDVSHEVFATAPDSPAWSKTEAEKRIKDTSVSGVNGVYKSTKIPFAYDYAGKDNKTGDNDTYDSRNDHGTHVAGIAAGNSSVMQGRAKDAQLVLMKVAADNTSSMYDNTILAALDDCAALDVDVINMSLGSACGFTSVSSYNKYFDTLKTAGIIVSVSAGNSGVFGYDSKQYEPFAAYPDYGTVAAPSTLAYATSVAAAKSVGDTNSLICDNTVILYVDAVSDNNITFENTVGGQACEYIYVDTDVSELSESEVSGKIVVCDNDVADASRDINAARQKKVLAFIMVSSDERLLQFSSNPFSFPIIGVGKSAGEVFKNAAVKQIEIKASMPIADFSSRGVTPDLELKPEIADYGVAILSSVPKASANTAVSNKYGEKDGTSMAAPNYSGSAASVLQAVRDEFGALSKSEQQYMVQQKLASAAKTEKSRNVPVSPRTQGAGRADIESAADTPAVIYNSAGKVKCELGDKLGSTTSFTFTVKNLTSSALTYNLSSEVITDAYRFDKNGAAVVSGSEIFDGASISFSGGNSITVPANGTKTVTAKLSIDTDKAEKRLEIFENGFFVEGYVYLNNSSAPELSVPFIGFYGDWTAAPIFAEAGLSPTGSDRPKVLMFGSSTGVSQKYRLNYGSKSETVYAPGSGVDGLFFYLNNIRNVKTVLIKLINKDSGNELKKLSISGGICKNQTDPNKFSGSVVGNESILQGLSAGDYILRFEAALDYTNSPTQTYDIGFTLDGETPAVEDAYIKTANGASTLYVKGADNTGEYSISLKTENATISSENCTDDGYDVFSLNGRSLTGASLEIYDPAGNTVTEDFASGNGFNAAYRNKALTRTERFDAWMLGNRVLNSPKMTAGSGESLRTFVWDDNMRPIYSETNN